MRVPYFRFEGWAIREAAKGTLERANALAWFIGGAVLWAILKFSGLDMHIPDTALGAIASTLLIGILSFAFAWLVIFAVRLFGAPARLWKKTNDELSEARATIAELRERFTPKLSLHFDKHDGECVKPTRAVTGTNLLYVRTRPVSTATSNGCVGHLLSVYRHPDKTGKGADKFADQLSLIWSNKGKSIPLKIPKVSTQHLDICAISELNNTIQICSEVAPTALTGIFNSEGTYDIRIMVMGEDDIPAYLSLSVTMGKSWRHPNIEVIPNES